jgi:hypothetical protein
MDAPTHITHHTNRDRRGETEHGISLYIEQTTVKIIYTKHDENFE